MSTTIEEELVDAATRALEENQFPGDRRVSSAALSSDGRIFVGISMFAVLAGHISYVHSLIFVLDTRRFALHGRPMRGACE